MGILMGRRIVLVMIVVSLSGCSKRASSDSDVEQILDGHTRMLKLLLEIKDRARNENNYTGDAEARKLRRELASLPPSGSNVQRFWLSWQLGFHESRLGRHQAATERLTAAYKLLPKLRPRLSTENQDKFLLQLAIVHLRFAETENCIHCNTNESCLLPIRGGGIHIHQDSTRKAIEYFKIVLDQNPENLTAQWLLNIAVMAVGGYPDDVPKRFLIPPETFESDEKFPRFLNIAPELGLNPLDMCGGSIVDDFDGDGFLDIVASTWDPAGQIHFFRNNADGTFSDRTEEAGLTGLFGGLNLLQADYDNDGDLDILVLRGAWLDVSGQHPNSLLQNDGKGRFRDVTFEAGLGEKHFPTQTASWADYDNDGDLDLYVGNEGFSCQLFENDGNGKFIDVAPRAGLKNGYCTKGVIWGDYNGDRLPDLYVSNLQEENRLYRNNGDGTFTDVAVILGVTKPIDSFPVWFWDFNNDGVLDLYVSSYSADVKYVAADYLGREHQAELNCLYQGDGQGGFREVSQIQNLARVSQTMGSNFGDLDHDGFPDFYLGTGYPDYEALMPNLMFHNLGGNGFADVTTAGGFGHLQKGHGVAFADLDNDGDQDIYMQIGGAFPGDAFGNALFENPGFDNHCITLKLLGNQSNRSAIGARIRLEVVEDGKKRSIYSWVNSGGSFGANPLRRQIGVGKATNIELLEIFWPTTDQTQRFRNVSVDQFLEITEGNQEYRKLPWKTTPFVKLESL
jgi:hypothetical protein